MVYRIYGRFIPNLTRKDGSAFEQQLDNNTKKNQIATKITTIAKKGHLDNFNYLDLL